MPAHMIINLGLNKVKLKISQLVVVQIFKLLGWLTHGPLNEILTKLTSINALCSRKMQKY
jgi:hypothetical protein